MILINFDYVWKYDERVKEEEEFFKVTSPEEIKICDPACGSGHMLTYAFDILYLIYEEEGYSSDTIPYLILKNNLYGIELDKRAGDLSAFALSIKARERDNNTVSEIESYEKWLSKIDIDLVERLKCMI